MDHSEATLAMNRYVRVASMAAAVDSLRNRPGASVLLPMLARDLLKPPALQHNAGAKACVHTSREAA